MSVIDTLITDRTADDVDALYELLSNGQNPSSSHKGAYNSADLNRVGEAVNYLRDRLFGIGIIEHPENWTESVSYQDGTGRPAIFSSNIRKKLPLKTCMVDILPVQAGSGDPSPSNVRAISGFASAKLYRTGKNHADQKQMTTASSLVWDGDKATWTVSNATNSNARVTVPLLAGVTYTLSCYMKVITRASGYNPRIVFRNMSWSVVKSTSMPSNTTEGFLSCTYTPTADTQMMVGVMGTGSTAGSCQLEISQFQLEIGSSRTAFETYQGQEWSFDFSDIGTVYGGALDVLSGTLTVTKSYIASYAGETLPGAWISSKDVYYPGTSPSTGAQVVYELAEPVIYAMAPYDVSAVPEQNDIWADCGEVSVEYPADVTAEQKPAAKAKANWTASDIPKQSQMRRYLDHVWEIWISIMAYRPETELPWEMAFLDYEGANQIEELLKETELAVSRIELSFRGYSGRQKSGVNCLP